MTTYRRLSDTIVDAHTIACSGKRQDIAEVLLRALELELQILGSYKSEERRSMELQEEAFVRHNRAFPNSHL